MRKKILEIKVNPGRLVFHAREGTPLRELLIREGILMDFPCGGRGLCGQCRVHVDPPPESGREKVPAEELSKGMRLACGVVLERNCTVTVPEGKETGGVWHDVTGVDQTNIPAGEALVTRKRLEVSPPSLEDQRSDWERVRAALQQRGYSVEPPDYTSLEELSGNLRRNDWQLSVLLEGNSFLCSCGEESERFYGFAVDLGTTTVDLALHNLESGRRIGRKTLLNRQSAFGADVISRAQAFATNRKAVRSAAIDTIQEAAQLILEETGIDPDSVVRTVVVGNSIMLHILHDLNPVQLTLSPYIGVISELVRRRPVDFGWTFQKHGYVETLPLISAFVGADTTGMILALGLAESEGASISVDIGTNGEVVLSREGRLFCTSTAAGPAFEGAQIACGIRAVPGAICNVRISHDEVSYEVLGGERPKGICGTGLIKLVAELLDAGLLQDTGRLLSAEEVENEALRNRLFSLDGMTAFAVTEDRAIYVTQKDIRELQLAKGAIRTAIESLLEEVGIAWGEVDLIRLAGNFGAGMDGRAEMRIGLFHQIDPGRIDVVGNAALRGAALVLVSKTYREKAVGVPQVCSFLELAGKPTFQNRFSQSMLFP
jgi:uncharacterized 2Fe-2S/4Fe-4S cluster protein (DUF4445 family)